MKKNEKNTIEKPSHTEADEFFEVPNYTDLKKKLKNLTKEKIDIKLKNEKKHISNLQFQKYY